MGDRRFWNCEACPTRRTCMAQLLAANWQAQDTEQFTDDVFASPACERVTSYHQRPTRAADAFRDLLSQSRPFTIRDVVAAGISATAGNTYLRQAVAAGQVRRVERITIGRARYYLYEVVA